MRFCRVSYIHAKRTCRNKFSFRSQYAVLVHTQYIVLKFNIAFNIYLTFETKMPLNFITICGMESLSITKGLKIA